MRRPTKIQHFVLLSFKQNELFANQNHQQVMRSFVENQRFLQNKNSFSPQNYQRNNIISFNCIQPPFQHQDFTPFQQISEFDHRAAQVRLNLDFQSVFFSTLKVFRDIKTTFHFSFFTAFPNTKYCAVQKV